MFKVGQKVVCVNVDPSRPGRMWVVSEAPSLGRVYTIADMWKDQVINEIVFDFIELSRSDFAVVLKGRKLGYGSWRFRPVVERKTDISIFTAMLNPAKAKEKV